MYGFLSVEERETRCFDYFNRNNIETREQLRECWKTNPITGVRAKFAEEMFSDFQDIKKYNEKRKPEIYCGEDYHQTFVLSDVHIPFHDEDTLRRVFDCVVDAQPSNIVLLGDILDCYSISRFCKRPDRVRNLQDEINIFYKLFKELRKAIPNTDIHYVLGNHEARLEKLVLENPGLFGLRNLSPEKLFRLDDLGMYYHKTKVKIDNFIYYHGDVVRKNAGYSAKAEYEDHKMQDGVSGHCFSEDVEILTKSGWKRVLDTEIGETVATINKNTKQFEWNKVKDKFVYDKYTELYRIKTDKIDLSVTDKHGLVGYNTATGKFEEFDAEYLYNTDNHYKFLCSAEYTSNVANNIDTDVYSLNSNTLAQKDVALNLIKSFECVSKDIDIYDVTRYTISELTKRAADTLQSIMADSGFACEISPSLKGGDDRYTITVTLNPYTVVGKENVTKEPYKGLVSCVSVDNGTLIVRSKGKTVITQNTHRLSSYYSTYEKQVGSWFENGCLCKIEPDYLNDPDKANWQQGFTVVDSYDGYNQGTQILIQNNRFCYGGTLYK